MPSAEGNVRNPVEVKLAPATIVTPKARILMESFGMSQEQITLLENSVLQYRGKYGGCLEKARNIITAFVQPGEKLAGLGYVIVPFFMDGMGRRIGGQCADLAYDLLFDLQINGFADNIHQDETLRELELGIALGNSRTYFVTTNHVWVNLFPKDQYEPLQSGCRFPYVVIDPAFQTIDTLADSGYYLNKTNLEGDANIRLSRNVEIFRLDAALRRWKIRPIGNPPFSLILGLSDDRSCALGLGFGILDENIRPMIVAWCANGYDRSAFFNSGNMPYALHTPNFGGVSPACERQAFEILEVLQDMKLSYPTMQDWRALQNVSMTRSWEDGEKCYAPRKEVMDMESVFSRNGNTLDPLVGD